MKRRTFVWLSAVSAASLYFPFSACKNPNGTTYSALAQPQFLGHICDAETLRAIGIAYKKKIPAEANEEQLANLIRTDAAGHAIPGQTDTATLQTLLDQKIKQDFEMGRMVVINGWVLSQTEARQCALFSSQT